MKEFITCMSELFVLSVFIPACSEIFSVVLVFSKKPSSTHWGSYVINFLK
jgi:hypothetical protein